MNPGVGIVTGLVAGEELFFQIGHADGGHDGWNPVFVRHELAGGHAGRNVARPLHEHGHAKAAF
jgi:hypothetical protein